MTYRFLGLLLCVLVLQACGGGDGEVASTAPVVPEQPAAVQPPPAPTTAPRARPLETPVFNLAASLRCSSGVDNATRTPVLLVHGTALNARNTFSWNYIPQLNKINFPYCTVDLPQNGMGDVQVAAEYVVYAVREMARRSQQKVQIIGHSQGGMVPRWALRFWPDIRAQVDDLVSLSGSHHGTLDAHALCALPCAPAIWQQRDSSAFLAALNKDFETLPEVDYTSIYTQLDEVVVPNIGPNASSRLRATGDNLVNVATQDVCPLNLADHLLIGTSDAVAYALAFDAITHSGPADPKRVARSICTQLFMPGVDPVSFPFDLLNLGTSVAVQLLNAPKVGREPELKCYVTGGC